MASATSVYLPNDLRDKVARLATSQGRSASSVIVESVRLRFARKDESAGTSAHHVARLERRLDKAIRDGMLVKESLLLFVRVWLEHNPPVEEELEASAAASAAARFERFLDVIANNIDAGRSLALFATAPIEEGEARHQGAAS